MFSIWVGGVIGLAMLIVFLGKYAVSINEVPLWFIIVIFGVVMPIVDFVKSLREGSASQDEGSGAPQ